MQNGIVILQHIPDIKNGTVPQLVGEQFIQEAVFVSIVCEPQNHLENKTSESHLLTESTARLILILLQGMDLSNPKI